MGERDTYLLTVLSRFLEASTGPEETERVLRAHPILQTMTVDVALASMVDDALERGDAESVRILNGRREILQACRELGLDQAITMMHSQFLVMRLVEAPTRAAKRQVIEGDPRILEVGHLALQHAIAAARAAGEQHHIRVLQSHLGLLARCRADGIDNAFAATFPD
jgi:hypothetical protein